MGTWNFAWDDLAIEQLPAAAAVENGVWHAFLVALPGDCSIFLVSESRSTMQSPKEMSPFLLRYARPCTSPGRHPPSEEIAYDESVDMTRLASAPGRPLLIDVPSAAGPVTKKCDIEKGEDQKDRRMWR